MKRAKNALRFGVGWDDEGKRKRRDKEERRREAWREMAELLQDLESVSWPFLHPSFGLVSAGKRGFLQKSLAAGRRLTPLSSTPTHSFHQLKLFWSLNSLVKDIKRSWCGQNSVRYLQWTTFCSLKIWLWHDLILRTSEPSKVWAWSCFDSKLYATMTSRSASIEPWLDIGGEFEGFHMAIAKSTEEVLFLLTSSTVASFCASLSMKHDHPAL